MRIAEIFHSIQGEGKYIGVPQIFVRFAGCDIGCAYCDTVTDAWQEMSLDEVLYRVDTLTHYAHSVVFTGGEPLQQPDSLLQLALHLRQSGRRVFLETNGICHQPLRTVVDAVDIVSMDVKLPSVAKIGPYWEEHRAFLEIAVSRDVFVKAVVSAHVEEEDLVRCGEMVAAVDSQIPLFLQPMHGDRELTLEQLRWMCDTCSQYVREVRCVAQMHKSLSIP